MNHYLLHEGYFKCDMVKHDVMIYELRVESLKARVEIQKGEFKSTSYEFKCTSYEFKPTSYEFKSSSSNQQVTSSNAGYTSSNPRIIKSMKTQLNGFKRPSFPKMTIPKLIGNSWDSSFV